MAKGKIMVVDDEQDVRDVVRLQLEQKGFNIIEATNGQEAIDLLRSGESGFPTDGFTFKLPVELLGL